jgi:two-component system chemotaxis sensor kinase CheA
MTLDLTQFHGVFFEESFEALDSMEAALLKLDIGAPDAERINTIFRVAHSIKGGSATFGFKDIASFTHSLETLLDEMRSGHMQVTQAISNILLKSVDVMRAMLRAVQNNQPIDAQSVADLQFDLELAIAQKDAAPSAPMSAPAAVPTSAPAPAVAEAQPSAAPVAVAPDAADSTTAASPATAPALTTSGESPRWEISFKPRKELLSRGNDPMRMLRELSSLGTVTTHAVLDALPSLDELDAQTCYLVWSIELVGPESEQAIRDVFDWAEGDCDLSITRLNPPAEQEATSDGVAEATANATADATAEAAPLRRPGASPEAAADAPAEVAHAPNAAALAAAPAAPEAAPSAVSTPAAPAAPAPAPAAPAAAQPTIRESAPAKSESGPTVGDSGSIRVSVEKIDELMNTVGELVITQAMLSQLGQKLEGPDAEQFRSSLANLERNMRGLQESVMRVRMLPISFVFSRFPRMARDLAQRLGKQIELKLTGQETELDKTVMEKIGDPLVHLVRNSIDHGVEMPDARLARGKPAFGTVHLDAYHRGGNIAVEVSDDGAGLDKDRILAKAKSRNLVGPNDILTDEQVYDLIFLPGFSTAEKTTDVSGRGVGMDVVRRNVHELGGKIEIRSFPGKGSKFLITLPLTLAIVDGQTVAVGGETYIVPLVSIVESMQLKPSQVSRIAGSQNEVISFRGDYLPIIRLHEVFGVEPRSRALHEGLIVVAEGDGRRVGLFVDDLLGQQQVVIKSLETNYGRIDGVSGATILGDGSVSLILDLPGLIRAASMSYAA